MRNRKIVIPPNPASVHPHSPRSKRHALPVVPPTQPLDNLSPQPGKACRSPPRFHPPVNIVLETTPPLDPTAKPIVIDQNPPVHSYTKRNPLTKIGPLAQSMKYQEKPRKANIRIFQSMIYSNEDDMDYGRSAKRSSRMAECRTDDEMAVELKFLKNRKELLGDPDDISAEEEEDSDEEYRQFDREDHDTGGRFSSRGMRED